MLRSVLVILLAIATVTTGCLGGADPTPGGDDGNATGEAPATSANRDLNESQPYRVDAEADGDEETAYPYRLGSGEPKEPVTLTFSGEFKPEDCGWSMTGDGERIKRHPFMDALTAGDVFLAEGVLTFTNTDENWGDIRLGLWVPGQSKTYDQSPAEERGEIVEVVETQSAWRGDDGDTAQVVVACWWGQVQESIPYEVTLELVFVRDAAPTGFPVGLQVPEDATHLFFSGKAIDPTQPTTAHWRLFDANDTPVGEGFFGLTSDEDVKSVPIEGGGEYVLYVEHVENGFLAAATNAPPNDSQLRLLDVEWQFVEVLTVAHETEVDRLVEFTLDRMPLALYGLTNTGDDGSEISYNVRLETEGPLGLVHLWQQGGHARFPDPVFLPVFIPPPVSDGWEWSYDHHALAPGAHTLHLTADAFHGRVYYAMSTYLRTGESSAPAPDFGGAGDGAASAIGGLDRPSQV